MLAASALVAAVLAGTAADARATFVGENGRIAFVRYHLNENADIYTINADGSGLRRLTNNEVFRGDSSYDSSPQWSPNGRWILFYRVREYEPGGLGIFTMWADGSHLTKLGDELASASWLRDGRVVYVGRDPEPGIYVVNADGTGRTRVGPDPQGTGLSWSRDGTRVAFTGCCGEPGPLDGATLNTMKMDGSEYRVILQFHRYSYPNPAWGPGPTIAFTRFHPSGGSDIYTIDFDGTGEAALTNDIAYDGNTEWSPDGSGLVFISNINSRPNDVFDVFSIAPDGSDRRNLTHASGRSEVNPTWSPDGERVAFSTYGDDESGLFTVDSDGTTLTQLTSHSGEEHDDQAAWQPLVRSSFHNDARFCGAHRDAVGDIRFAERYASDREGRGAFGRCVNGR